MTRRTVSSNAINFIKSLLTIDPSKRLGHDGSDKVKKHEWLKDINFK